MTRLADRFVAKEWAFPLGMEADREYLEQTAAKVQNHPVLLASNVAEYIDQRGETDLEDFPSLAPPWPAFWVEYPSSSGHQRRGVHVFDGTGRGEFDLHNGYARKFTMEEHPFANRWVDSGDVEWVIVFALFVELRQGVWGPIGVCAVQLGPDGAPLGCTWSMNPLTDLAKITQGLSEDKPDRSADDIESELTEMQRTLEEGGPEIIDKVKADFRKRLDRVGGELDELDRHITKRLGELDDVTDAARALGSEGGSASAFAGEYEWLVRALAPAFQAVAFLHCRNVEVDTVDAPPKVQAKRTKRGKRPLLRYHTLRLVVPRKQSDGGEGPETHHKALHIVAGHFAHYGSCCTSHEPKGLLFGKYEGVYWVASHVRGNADRGVVRTDFDLVAP